MGRASRQKMAAAAGVAAVVWWAGVLGAQTTVPSVTKSAATQPVALAGATHGAELKQNIEYGRAAAGAATTQGATAIPGDVSLRLDASIPAGAGPFPIIIMVHGGGWSSGDKQQDITPILEALTGRFTWFSINYRMAPQNRWPACLEDVQTAIRWAKAHAAEYKGDPKHIALMGHSAGGHLVCLAATLADDSTRVQAVVGLAPVTDLEADTARRGGLSKSLQALLDATTVTPALQAKLHEMSPIQHVAKTLPPFLLIQGGADKTVPIEQTLAFAARLRAAGVACAMMTIEGGVHAITDWSKLDAGYQPRMVAWLQETLANSK